MERPVDSPDPTLAVLVTFGRGSGDREFAAVSTAGANLRLRDLGFV